MPRHVSIEASVRTFLRVISIWIGLQIAYSVLLIWRMARFGDIGELSRSGVLGLTTMLGWLLTLSVGPLLLCSCGG